MAARSVKIVEDVVDAVGTAEFPALYMAAKEWLEEQTGKIQDAAALDIERRVDKGQLGIVEHVEP